MKFSAALRIITVTMACTVGSSVTHSADKASRDWTKNPAVVELQTTQDIYAVSDAHGDPATLADVLVGAKLAELVPASPDPVKWTGGKAVLVVVGDLIDKGSDSLGVIALLRALQADAAAQGGQVIISMGNHEAEFLADPGGKKTRAFANELKAAGLEPMEVGNCGGDIGQFLCGMPIAVKINDWFFSHGGNTSGRTIAELSRAIEAGFARDGFATEELVGDNSILEARLNKKGPGGMAWFYAGNAKTDPKKLLALYAQNLGVQHMVQGHQYGAVKFSDGKSRKEEHLFQRYGILFLIDGAMSSGIEDSGSTGGALRIAGQTNNQQVDVVCAHGQVGRLWDSRSRQGNGTKHCPN
jgi:hypothetical protein